MEITSQETKSLEPYENRKQCVEVGQMVQLSPLTQFCFPQFRLQQTINVKWEEKSCEVYSLKKCAGEEKKTCSNSQWRSRVYMHMCSLMESSHRDRAVLEVTKETTLTRSHRQDGDENTGGRASLRRM